MAESAVHPVVVTSPAAPARMRPRRKNIRLDQARLDQVREVLGARTETEAIEMALDLVLFRREVVVGLRRVAGSGVVRDIHARRR